MTRQRYDNVIDSAVANGATTGSSVDQRPFALAGVQLPAALTSTTLKFQVSADRDKEEAARTYQDLYDETNTLVSITVAQGRSYALPAALAPWPFFKPVLGSNEAAARTLRFVGKD